jgi:hypothetical protein
MLTGSFFLPHVTEENSNHGPEQINCAAKFLRLFLQMILESSHGT